MSVDYEFSLYYINKYRFYLPFRPSGLSLNGNLSHRLYGVIGLNKRLLLLPFRQDKQHSFSLFVCAALFIIGVVVGTFSAHLSASEQELSELISQYLTAYLNSDSTQPSLLINLADAFKYQLAAIFLGFSVLGVFCIPLLAAVRGFFLSFSVSIVIRLLGWKGVWLALSMFGISTIITIPCFFILSITAFSSSARLYQMARSKTMRAPVVAPDRKMFAVCAICLIAVFLSALIDAYLTPLLIRLAASQILL